MPWKGNHINASQIRHRLAYVSPLPPEKSGIADYSADLLPELAKSYWPKTSGSYLRRVFNRKT